MKFNACGRNCIIMQYLPGDPALAQLRDYGVHRGNAIWRWFLSRRPERK